jgi:hypothetical protein
LSGRPSSQTQEDERGAMCNLFDWRAMNPYIRPAAFLLIHAAMALLYLLLLRVGVIFGIGYIQDEISNSLNSLFVLGVTIIASMLVMLLAKMIMSLSFQRVGWMSSLLAFIYYYMIRPALPIEYVLIGVVSHAYTFFAMCAIVGVPIFTGYLFHLRRKQSQRGHEPEAMNHGDR